MEAERPAAALGNRCGGRDQRIDRYDIGGFGRGEDGRHMLGGVHEQDAWVRRAVAGPAFEFRAASGFRRERDLGAGREIRSAGRAAANALGARQDGRALRALARDPQREESLGAFVAKTIAIGVWAVVVGVIHTTRATYSPQP